MTQNGNARIGIVTEGRGNHLFASTLAGLGAPAQRDPRTAARHTQAMVGIAGLDEQKRLSQARESLNLGDGNGSHAALSGDGQAACFGVSGIDRPLRQTPSGRVESSVEPCAAAGTNPRQIQRASLGMAGNLAGPQRAATADALRQRDVELAAVSPGSKRLGDRAAREAWQRGVWFADYTYVVKDNGRTWRKGRESVFARKHRALPTFLDSAGYRRELSGTAPQWSHAFATYPAAIELVDPDGYAWYDYPRDKARTLRCGKRLMRLFPNDVVTGRQWPVWSLRWSWRDDAHLAASQLPGWASSSLAGLIPLTRTQRKFKEETRERWARLAIANALLTAADPDFCWMADTFGRVMIGGMIGSGCPRMARHLYLATLYHAFPGVHFWGLGQASATVVNGLGMLGLLDRIWCDGTWWILDATADRFAVVEQGLITTISFEGWARSLFTLTEAMAANLRSLLAAYAGLWAWPPPEPLPLDLLDPEQAREMQARLRANTEQLALDL